MVPFMTIVFAGVFMVIPPLLLRSVGKSPKLRPQIWLVGAAAAVGVSWWLPSPILSDYTSTFSQHLAGGGVSSALVAFYFMDHLRMPTWRHRLAMVLAVASILGVANEIFELWLDFNRGTRLRRDASFDLLANTVGALVTWVAVEIVRRR